MKLSLILSIALVGCSLICLGKCEVEEEAGLELYKIEGKVTPPDFEPDDWLASTKVLVNGGEHLGFLRDDGSFVVSNVPSGSYVVEVTNSEYGYEPVRVEINSKGKIRARKLNFIQTSTIVQMPYPLKFKMMKRIKYFQLREQWKVTDFLFSPMVLMMILPLFLIMVMPKLMNAADPDTQREMQQTLQGPNMDIDISEKLTSWFGGGPKKPAAKPLKASKKRQ